MHSKVRVAASSNSLFRTTTNLADTLPGHDQEVTASGDRQARGLPCAIRHGRNPKRKTRGSNSPTPSSRKKQRPVRGSQAAVNSGYDSESEDEPDELEGAETEMRQIRICDVGHDYYEVAFRSINQLCCKDINKAWIRVGQPKKQTSHPYNGGKTSTEKSQAEHGYLGHYSMPDYWPSDENWTVGWGCRHREPDHVRKSGQSVRELVPNSVLISHVERLILLVHLLRSQGKGFKDGDFSIDKLKQATAGIHLECERKTWKPEYVERLEEIYWVREKEMKFENGEIGEFSSTRRRPPFCVNVASDGDTLVSVRMPKPRCKNRKASKSSAKVERPSGKQIKREPEERSSTTCDAPTTNMDISLQIEEDDLDPSEVSEPTILGDRSSSTEEVAPDASCLEPTLCRARTIQHGLPFSDSLSPTDSRHSSVKENWTPQSVNFGQDPAVFTHPGSFGSVATRGEAQNAMPLYDQCYSGSSSMQSFSHQEVVRRQFDHESATSQRVANQMRPGPHQVFTRSLPIRPIARKAENICQQTFSASSSGLAGAFPIDADYPSWQANDLWNTQAESSMYMNVADPNTSFLPSTNGSCSSGYNNASYSTGLQVDTWNDGNQGLLAPYNHTFDENASQQLNLQTVNNPGYQTDTMSGVNLSNHFMYAADCRTNTSMGTERRFGRSSRDQQRF